MVNYTHDSMTSVMTYFPIGNFPCVSSNIPESFAYVVNHNLKAVNQLNVVHTTITYIN